MRNHNQTVTVVKAGLEQAQDTLFEGLQTVSAPNVRGAANTAGLHALLLETTTVALALYACGLRAIAYWERGEPIPAGKDSHIFTLYATLERSIATVSATLVDSQLPDELIGSFESLVESLANLVETLRTETLDELGDSGPAFLTNIPDGLGGEPLDDQSPT